MQTALAVLCTVKGDMEHFVLPSATSASLFYRGCHGQQQYPSGKHIHTYMPVPTGSVRTSLVRTRQ